MYIKKSQVKNAFNRTSAVCNDMNVKFRISDLNLFKTTLDSIASARNYSEGQSISKDDLDTISTHVINLIDGMTQHISKNTSTYLNEKGKMPIPVDFVMAAGDYLYMMAMDKLGCPDIPTLFGASVQQNLETSAMNIHRAFVKYDMSKESAFKAQRGKNADVMRKEGVDELIKVVGKNTGTSRQSADLLANYQALKERQNRHGAIWRFFHREENLQRTALLNDMKSALNARFKNSINLDNASPSETARKLADINIRGTFDRARNERLTDPEQVYDLDEPNRAPLSEIENFNLFNDVNDKDKDLNVQPPVKDNQKPNLEKSNNDFSIM